MAMVATPAESGGRSSMKEINVIGTMQLLAACQKADSLPQAGGAELGLGVRRLPARSGRSSPRRCRRGCSRGPASARTRSRSSRYVRGLARRRPDVAVTTLRLANLMGAGVDSQVTRYLSLPVVPRVMGFDARLQFLHPTDAVAALLLVDPERPAGHLQRRRRRHRHADPGAADDGPALVRRAAGHGAADGRRWSGRPGLGDFSTDQIAALTYGRGMDTTRFAAASRLGSRRYSSRPALEEFVGPGRRRVCSARTGSTTC